MRNLKKILALVLALMMTLSLMVTASAVKFEDSKDSAYATAIDVMSGIGVIDGMEGGFNPKGTLTREQAAKIITYMVLGPEVAATLGTPTAPFKDVPAGKWSAGSVAYCANAGIVNGRGDGTFDPTATLTGNEFGKMLLVAIGAGDGARYSGSGYPINVAIDAKKANLLSGLNVNLNGPITREQACQMAFNGLVYTPTSAGTGDWAYDPNNGWVQRPGSASSSLASNVFNLNTVSGVVTSNGAISAGVKTTTISGESNALAVSTGLDLVGHQVTAYYQDADKGGDYDANEVVYSVVDNSTTLDVVPGVTTDADLKAALGVSTLPSTWSYTKYDGVYDSGSGKVSTDPKSLTGTAIIYNKNVISFVEPTAYTLDKVTNIVTTAGSEAITLYNNNSSALSLNNNATSDVVDEYAGIAKDDYVVYSKTGDVYHLTKAQTVTGTPSRIDDTTVTLGGVAYAKSGTDNADLSDVAASAMSFGSEYTLYLDGQGNYITATAKSTAAAASNVVYVVAKYQTSTTETDSWGATATTISNWVQCVDMSGQQVIYQVTDEAYKATTGANVITAGTLQKVSVGYDATLKANVATFTASGAKDTTATLAANAVKFANTNDYFASNVTFLFVTGEKGTLKVDVKSGVQALTSKPVTYVADRVGTSSNYTVQYVVVEAAYTAPVVSGSGVMYLPSDTSTAKVPYTDADGKTQNGYEFTAYIDGAEKTITVADADGDVTYSGFVTYTISNNVYTITGANAASNLKAATVVTNMFNGLISTKDVSDVSVAGATVVNLSNNTLVPTDPTALSTADTVALVLNADGTAVVTIYVTTSTRS